MSTKAKTILGGSWLLALTLCLFWAGPAAGAQAGVEQTVYAPVYQKVVIDERGRELTLTTELSLRNVDPARAVELLSVALYDSQGRLIKQYLPKPAILPPLATRRIHAQPARQGGGGCFLVRWRGPAGVNPPLIQTLMMGTAGQQGISLMSEGRPLRGPAQ